MIGADRIAGLSPAGRSPLVPGSKVADKELSAAADKAALGVQIHGLRKAFGPVQALAGVDLAVPLGSVTALVGRNGAGKSTLVRVLATSVSPDSGTVRVGGHDVVGDSLGARCQTGLALGEDRSFFWRLSGRKNLEFFARLYGFGRAAARSRVEETLVDVDLLDVADRRVDRYSTGMRSRLGLARALLGRPPVLLLDEPTRSLDPAAAGSVRDLLGRLLVSGERCVVLATHDLAEAASLASEIVVLRAGTVVARHRPPFDLEQVESAIRGTP